MAQSVPDSRWITVRETYDHYWSKTAVTHFPPGEYRVKSAVADGAIGKGKATEGKADGSEAAPPAPKKPRRARKGKTAVKKASKTASDVQAADNGPIAPVGDAGTADADRTADQPPVGPDAE